tara:strand:+ start:604 stop:5472 length:4869 start_codon:yes stop_codon:yes gene_type:complete
MQREVAALERIVNALPSDWYGYTGFSLRISRTQRREIDLIVVATDRIFLVDLKDWSGRVHNVGGKWYRGNEERERSACEKIEENAKFFASKLKQYVEKGAGKRGYSGRPPFVEGLVVFTNTNVDFNGLSDDDKANAISLDEFLKLADPKAYSRRYPGSPRAPFNKDPLYSSTRKHSLSSFVTNSPTLKPTEIVYGAGYRVSGEAEFKSQNGLYSEYPAELVEDPNHTGVLRIWDFAQMLAGGGDEDTRKFLAGREHRTLGYIRNLDSELYETSIIHAQAREPECSVRFWELFDVHRDARRAENYFKTRGDQLDFNARLDRVKFLVSAINSLHKIQVAHRDIGPHSVWVDGQRLKLSNFCVSYFPDPDQRTISSNRVDMMGAKSTLPEDILEEISTQYQKDVFLTAVLCWSILTGKQLPLQGDVPSFEGIDSATLAAIPVNICNWFKQSLAWEPKERFASAKEMLAALNRATQSKEDETFDATADLSSFKIDQHPLTVYPSKGAPVTSTERMNWQSTHNGVPVFVKSWFSHSASDLSKRAFLLRADKLKSLNLTGIQKILDVGIAVDFSLFLVSATVPESRPFSAETISTFSRDQIFILISDLIRAVLSLHDCELFHGDVKPSNIMITNVRDKPATVLVDLPDFSPTGPSDHQTARYCPPSDISGQAGRDRFAVCRCVEDVLTWIAPNTLSQNEQDELRAACNRITEGSPANTSLAPLQNTIKSLTAAPQGDALENEVECFVSSPNIVEDRVFHPDNGFYSIDVQPHNKDAKKVVFRVAGAAHNLLIIIRPDDWSVEYVKFNDDVPTQTISHILRKAQHRFAGKISVSRTGKQSLGQLLPELRLAYAAYKKDELNSALFRSGIKTKPNVHDTVERDTQTAKRWTTRQLWLATVLAEPELMDTVTITGEPKLDGKGYLVGFQLPDDYTQVLSFDASDSVQLTDLNGARIAMVDPTSIGNGKSASMTLFKLSGRAHRELRVFAGRQYRIVSRNNVESYRRRKGAIESLLAGGGLIPDLVDYFDPNTNRVPIKVAEPVVSGSLDRYGLNATQLAAFEKLWQYGPIGLLQGPPGTGKTNFIAALSHYAVTQGGLNSVLILSQANESTNHAAEKVLDFSAEYGGNISIIRVGNAGKVSDRLKDYHSDAIQDRYRQKFKAEIKERILGIAPRITDKLAFVSDLYDMTTELGDVIEHLNASIEDGEDTQFVEKRESRLLAAYRNHARTWLDDEQIEPETALYHAQKRLEVKHGITNSRELRRIDHLIKMSRQWMNALATHNSSLESFFVRSRAVVSGTCVGIGRHHLGMSSMQFDLVIIDEAARATAGELAIGLQVASRALLVGDQCQLLPMYDRNLVEEIASRVEGLEEEDVKVSDFQRMFENFYGQQASATLTTQYRMASDIAEVVAEDFYPQYDLKTGRGPVPEYYSLLPAPLDRQIVWLDTTSNTKPHAYQERPNLRSTSFINKFEADVILEQLESIRNAHEFVMRLAEDIKDGEQAIGVICMYAAQATYIRERISLRQWEQDFERLIKVDTVDSYQGKDNELIILSLTRRDPDGKASIGHVSNENRMNVALSRAKNRLIIVGALHVFEKDAGRKPNPLLNVARRARNAEDQKITLVDAMVSKRGH